LSAIADSAELGRRIRRLRSEHHLTLKQVEEASGLSATHLSEIERGHTSPTIGALVRIARALGRNASYFIEAEVLADVAHVPREGRGNHATPGGVRVEPLTPGVPGSHLFAYRLTLDQAPGQFALEAQEPPSEALYYVRRGRVETSLGETRVTLAAGDAVQASLGQRHVLRALDADGLDVIAVLTHRLELGE
jgi:transcriptional regulator with XRE-family HTH domain